MKLLINTASTYKGGGVQVAKSFLEECRNYTQHTYHAVLGDMLNQLIDPTAFPENFYFYHIGFRPATRVFHFKSRDKFFRQLESEIKPDMVFTTSGPAYWRPKVPHLVGYNLPHYIYRDSPYFDQVSLMNRVKWDLKGKVIKYFFTHDADAYVTQTNDVNRRLREWLGTRSVHTVTNTYSADYLNPKPIQNKLQERSEGGFRFLALSAWYPHKNLDIIPKVLENLSNPVRNKVKFVLTLPEDVFIEKFPEKYHVNLINTGPVKPDECPALYRECDALFLPTLLECFSASYAEAMAMKIPILTTDMGFAQSICENAALYFKPADPVDAARKAQVMMDDDKLRNELVASGKIQLTKFDTPKERAEKYLAICKNMID